MIETGLNAPLASSAGRLFDAVAAALGICFDQIDFEGQAAMQLQSLAEECPKEAGAYPVEIGPILEWQGLWQCLLADIAAGVPPPVLSARFHNSVCDVVVRQALDLSKSHDISSVMLSGGVFQNRLLLGRIKAGLIARGLTVLVAHQFTSLSSPRAKSLQYSSCAEDRTLLPAVLKVTTKGRVLQSRPISPCTCRHGHVL